MTPLESLTAKIHARQTHGLSKTRPYRIWAGMLARCRNKNTISYPRYGGKGVTVCNEWLNFVNFWEDMKDTYFDEATIDRIDNLKGYLKENCRWVQASDQSKNRSCNRYFTFEGETMTLAEWERKAGLKYGTLRARINHYGMSFEEAIKKPVIAPLGYFYDPRRPNNPYRVQVKLKQKAQFVGRYRTKEEALSARKQFLDDLLPSPQSK